MAITSFFSAMRGESRSLESASVINSAAWPAITGMADSSDATVTNPAPARSAAIPHMAAAPVLPCDPAIASTCPKVPLCPARGRGASNARNMAGSTSDSQMDASVS